MSSADGRRTPARRPRAAPRGPRSDVATSAADLRDVLRAEVLDPSGGDRLLPDERTLQRVYGASRGAVRGALDLLRAEGLVTRLPGQGTSAVGRGAHHRVDDLRSISTLGGPVRHEVVLRRTVTAQGPVAALLDLTAGAPALRLDRRTVADGEPVGAWTSYLPLDVAAPLLECPASDLAGDYYEALERVLGVACDHEDLTTEAVAADDVVAAVLGVAVGVPVLRLERVLRLADGRPLEFGVGRFRGDRLRLSVRRRRGGA